MRVKQEIKISKWESQDTKQSPQKKTKKAEIWLINVLNFNIEKNQKTNNKLDKIFIRI